jgi:hypothetical protein
MRGQNSSPSSTPFATLVDKERTIHTLLRRHPDLIDASLKGLSPEYEFARDDKRLDLAFQIRNRVTVVEIKRTALTTGDVDQIVGYCKKIEAESKLGKQHFLVGKRPSDTRKLETHIKTQAYKIVSRYLLFDVPTDLIWDNLEKRYVVAHDGCFNNPRYQNHIKLRV